MPRTFEFGITAHSTADAHELFAVIAAGHEWSRLLRPLVTRSEWERTGTREPGGVGAVRKIGTWPVFVRERVLEYIPDRAHAYTLVGRSPVRDYRAEVTLTPRVDGGTDLRWSGTFTERFPSTGLAIRYVLYRVVRFLAIRLVRAAESAPRC